MGGSGTHLFCHGEEAAVLHVGTVIASQQIICALFSLGQSADCYAGTVIILGRGMLGSVEEFQGYLPEVS